MPKLLAAVSDLRKQVDAKTEEINIRDEILDALLEGWGEPCLAQLVIDTKKIFKVCSDIKLAGGDYTLASKKANTSLLCISKVASSIGQSHLYKAMRNFKGREVFDGIDGSTNFASRTMIEDSINEIDIEKDHALLFLHRQATGV